MFRLIRGDENKLEGRALFYLENECDCGSLGKWPAMYTTKNKEDFIQLSGDYRVQEKIREHMSQIKDFNSCEIDLGEGKDKIRVPTVEIAMLDLKDEEDAQRIPGDIIRLGNIPGCSLAIPTLTSGIDLYIRTYHNQLITRKMGERSTNNMNIRKILEYSPEEFSSYMYEVMGKILGAESSRDESRRSLLIKEIEESGKGSNFEIALTNIANILRKGNCKYQEIEIRIKMIEATRKERYEEAAKLKKDLEKLV